MSTISQRPHSPDAADAPATAPGTLTVEVPHWTARVVVYDELFRPVPGVGPVTSRADAPDRYEATVSLPPAIYEVEVALAGRAERELVPVRPGYTARVDQTRWRGLLLRSAAPLLGTATVRDDQAAAAATWSRETTWPGAPAGDSRLFLFVRTLDPRRYPSFATGLHLLDADGRSLTDFSDGVALDAEQGWMAFSAALPAGSYILRRARAGAPVRFQPVVLAPGWETHVLVEAARYPRLHSLALNMAPLGDGFRPDDEAALAAEVLLDTLGGAGSDEVATSPRMTELLDGPLRHPWLAIVAAHALLAGQGRAARRARSDGQAAAASRLLGRVLDALDGLPDHPDVRALRLDDGQPAGEFWQPPVLRAGLKRVQRHATLHADTVPLDSLTDCVLDNAITNSPWTAWGKLDRRPRRAPDAAAPRARGGKQLLTTKRVDRRRPTSPATVYGAALAQAAPAAAPVFFLPREPEASDWQVASIPATLVQAAGRGPQEDQALAKTARAVVRGGQFNALPDAIDLDVDAGLTNLLATVEPKDASRACGLPLARTERGMDLLRATGREKDARASTPAATANRSLTGAEQAIVGVALQKTLRPTPPRARTAPPVGDAAPAADAPPADPPPLTQATPRSTIEENVAKLRTEADRLTLAVAAGANEDASNPTARAGMVADRLRRVADRLLAGADFAVITDTRGRMVSGNGAFIELLSTPEQAAGAPTADVPTREETLRVRQPAWEAALADLPVGKHRLAAPAANPVSAEWELRRTAVHDRASRDVRAYLNVLRSPNAPRVTQAMLERTKSLLPDLSFHAPLFAYGSRDDRDHHLPSLESLADRFEQIVGLAEPPPTGSPQTATPSAGPAPSTSAHAPSAGGDQAV